ncbi:unnamed protein product [Ostreobium quekettii]|uniref:Uncharacterized protein n=1 Tax=Ostreobium quekettii TaxID=121088 RepID=A0A8S1IUA7_9CHLO|nr:unnamed protein product [Ostreobium quekettii]
MNEYSVPKQFPRIREKRGYHVKNPCLSAVVVDSEEVLKGAAEAAAAARPCVARPTASEESSEDLDARKVRQRKRITAALASRSGASALGDTDVGGAPSVKPFAEDAGAGGGSSKGTAGTQTGDAMPGKVASEKKKRKGKRERKRAAREKAAENGTK